MDLDTTRWSGDGAFTQLLIAALRALPHVTALRVEDATASRADSGYNLIANEIFVTPAQGGAGGGAPRLLPWRRRMPAPLTDLSDIAAQLAQNEAIGEPDYADDGMIQYLRTERVVAPYQTRGVKVVELVRIYRAGAARR